jgi:hypothetical protein
MYNMDVGCSLKGTTASTVAQLHGLHTYIINNSLKYGELSTVVTVLVGRQCSSTTIKGVQTPQICMAWMWDTFERYYSLNHSILVTCFTNLHHLGVGFWQILQNQKKHLQW